MWCSGAAAEAGNGAERGGQEQGEAAEEPAGAHRVHAHAEDHTHLHPQPLQGECTSTQVVLELQSQQSWVGVGQMAHQSSPSLFLYHGHTNKYHQLPPGLRTVISML